MAELAQMIRTSDGGVATMLIMSSLTFWFDVDGRYNVAPENVCDYSCICTHSSSLSERTRLDET